MFLLLPPWPPAKYEGMIDCDQIDSWEAAVAYVEQARYRRYIEQANEGLNSRPVFPWELHRL